jgi:outer membrane lipoprotein-sorting protein
MRRLLFVPCALALALPALGRADDAADAKALIDKAVKAHGGADALAKQKAAVTKMKGKFYGLGEAIDYTSQTSSQTPDKMRTDINASFMGTDIKVVQVVNGDKGWLEDPQGKREMSKEELEEVRNAQNAQQIARLGVLSEKDYALSPLGEVKVGDKEAVGVVVKHKGYRDVSLFFDKKTNMLLKAETRVKDPQRGGDTEMTQETLYDDYKKVEGAQIPHKVTIKRDGKNYVEAEVTEFKPQEKIDDSVFAKP